MDLVDYLGRLYEKSSRSYKRTAHQKLQTFAIQHDVIQVKVFALRGSEEVYGISTVAFDDRIASMLAGETIDHSLLLSVGTGQPTTDPRTMTSLVSPIGSSAPSVKSESFDNIFTICKTSVTASFSFSSSRNITEIGLLDSSGVLLLYVWDSTPIYTIGSTPTDVSIYAYMR